MAFASSVFFFLLLFVYLQANPMEGPKHSVLFVCLGNICRSPMAEIVFSELVKQRTSEWRIDSAGTASYHVGDSPDQRTSSVCKKHFSGLKVTHRGRQINDEDFKEFDYIFCMDKSNLRNLQSMAPKDATAKIALLGEYDPEKELIVEDPYYGGISDFEHIFAQITRCCNAFLDTIYKQ